MVEVPPLALLPLTVPLLEEGLAEFAVRSTRDFRAAIRPANSVARGDTWDMVFFPLSLGHSDDTSLSEDINAA